MSNQPARKLSDAVPLVRPLSKSRFKTACECPTKLFYSGKKDYGNNNLDDPFLKALQRGGFQIGALAQVYHPGGVVVSSLKYEESLARTRELLERPSVVIFEAAFVFETCFIRADVVVKEGNKLHLHEVKAKSWKEGEDSFWLKRKEELNSKFLSYLEDITFQHHVVSSAYPGFEVIPYLCLVDKKKKATVEGLNQKFLLRSDGDGRRTVTIAPGVAADTVGEKLLVSLDVTKEVRTLKSKGSYAEEIRVLAESYLNDKKIPARITTECKSCEYRIKAADFPGAKSGFDECWKEAMGAKESDASRARVFDVWSFPKASELLGEGIYFLDELSEEDVQPKTKSKKEYPGLTPAERKWKQIEKYKDKDATPYIDREGLRSELAEWKFPLHFIDFETTMVAIPFNKGRRPYEQTAFQFSHHVVHADGRIEHKGEWINTERGKFPNFDFVRALKKELDGDEGTILRYAAHENTVLCQIYTQLRDSDAADANELCDWIKTVTKSTGSMEESWEGARKMVDMLETVKCFYYHPLMGGSNSIKMLLPALMSGSEFLKKKYSMPIYGAKNGIPSRNFENKAWIELENGNVKDPYASLPTIFDGLDRNTLDRMFFEEDDELKDGGAAMIAYAKMQFTEMSDAERNAAASALLRYCELDTMAMVMVWEAWKDAVGMP